MARWLYLSPPSYNHREFFQRCNLEAIFAASSDDIIRHKHPLIQLFPDFQKEPSTLLEGLFHIHAFHYLEIEPHPLFVHGYYLYLLLLGFFNKFLVQQVEQFGFDQFQKLSDNELRAGSEKNYLRRFYQLSGNSGQDVAFVEGRFSPKGNYDANITLFKKILGGFAEFQGDNTFDLFQSAKVSRHNNRMDLRLVAHFIKKAEDVAQMGIKVRHQKLRKELEKQARALLAARQQSSMVHYYVTGIDAAANELHAGPEVFAPLYRRFRRQGFVHFTFHVGEDYIHLVSGLRAMYEAIDFLDLRRGNRIGHGTAAGIDPQLWLDAVGNKLVIAKGEWLDNLVFAYEILKQSAAGGVLARIMDKINQYVGEIYGESGSAFSTLRDAWKMRLLDPLIACDPSRLRTETLDWKEHQEWALVEKWKAKSPAGFDLFRKYHQQLYAERAAKTIQLDLQEEIFTADVLKVIQNHVLNELHRREIAIESMPTSNVRISFYQSHRQHHLWRWLGLENGEKDQPLPPVCLSSDDPGIFATTLRNEYSQVYSLLMEKHKLSPSAAIRYIRELADNAEAYRFSEKKFSLEEQ